MRNPPTSRWIARGISLLILWAPIVLVLTVLHPTVGRPPPLHGLTALVLSLIVEHVLTTVFWIPVAQAASGRHRVLPRSPHLAVHGAALGLGLVAYGLWVWSSGESPGVAVVAVGVGACWLWGARFFRRLPLWGGWFEVHDGLLSLQGTTRDYSVPVGQVRAVHRRTRDGSFWIETPWEARNTLVPTRGAQGRYWVEDAEALLRLLGPAVEVREVKALIGLLSGRRR